MASFLHDCRSVRSPRLVVLVSPPIPHGIGFGNTLHRAQGRKDTASPISKGINVFLFCSSYSLVCSCELSVANDHSCSGLRIHDLPFQGEGGGVGVVLGASVGVGGVWVRVWAWVGCGCECGRGCGCG